MAATASGIDASPDSLQSLDAMTVRSSRPITSAVDQKKIEQTIGIVDDLNVILLQKPGVTSIPEAGSMLLVNGEGPFDNIYLVRGIPVFAPSNFAGHTFADRSVVALTLPNAISFTASDMAGKLSGASGSVISIDPYILKTSNRVPRPEAALGFGSLTTDLSVNFPARKARDRYQISYSLPNAFSLLERSVFYGASENLGYGIPADAWNLRALGEQSTKSVRFRQLIWGGVNTYGKNDAEALKVQQGNWDAGDKYPWAIAAFSASDSTCGRPWNLTVGTSRQNYFEARKIASWSPYKIVGRTSAALAFHSDIPRGAASSADFGILAEHLGWKGEELLRKGGIADTVDTTLRMKRSGQSVQLNSNQGFFNSGKAFFLDPGASVALPAGSGEIEVALGLNSAPADIRGLPGLEFDRILSRTYNAHATARQRPCPFFNFSAEVFLKYKDRFLLYENSPYSLSWDDSRKASLLAAGGSGQIEMKAGKWFLFNTNIFAGRSMVNENGRKFQSDWEVPYAVSTSLSFAIKPERMKVFAIGNFMRGRPYRDILPIDSAFVISDRQLRLPNYTGVDLKFEWRQPTDGDFVTEYDAFFLVQNVFDWENVRDFQWYPLGIENREVDKLPVRLSPLSFQMGFRVNFRFLYW
jgi:hypothetical protein